MRKQVAHMLQRQHAHQAQVLTEGFLTVESSTPPATGRAVGAHGRHDPRLRHHPRVAVGWKWICASALCLSSSFYLLREHSDPDGIIGTRHLVLREQPPKVYILSRAPAFRGCGAPTTIQ